MRKAARDHHGRREGGHTLSSSLNQSEQQVFGTAFQENFRRNDVWQRSRLQELPAPKVDVSCRAVHHCMPITHGCVRRHMNESGRQHIKRRMMGQPIKLKTRPDDTLVTECSTSFVTFEKIQHSRKVVLLAENGERTLGLPRIGAQMVSP